MDWGGKALPFVHKFHGTPLKGRVKEDAWFTRHIHCKNPYKTRFVRCFERMRERLTHLQWKEPTSKLCICKGHEGPTKWPNASQETVGFRNPRRIVLVSSILKRLLSDCPSHHLSRPSHFPPPTAVLLCLMLNVFCFFVFALCLEEEWRRRNGEGEACFNYFRSNIFFEKKCPKESMSHAQVVIAQTN